MACREFQPSSTFDPVRSVETLLVVVVYDCPSQFLTTYLDSVLAQDTAEFDVAVIADGGDVRPFHRLGRRLRLLDANAPRTPSLIRQQAVDFARSAGYSFIVFSDVDDYFTPLRVSQSVAGLRSRDFVYNEIDVVTATGDLVAPSILRSIGVTDTIQDYRELLHRNVLGLSHTAVRTDALNDIRIPREVVAVDWFLYSALLVRGRLGAMVDQCSTFYRQTSDSLVGFARPLTEERFRRGIAIKRAHYEAMIGWTSGAQDTEASLLYSSYLERLNELDVACQDWRFLGTYLATVNRHFSKIYQGWWSEILLLPDWRRYAE